MLNIKLLKINLKNVLIYIIVSVICFSLLIISSCLPNKTIKKNIRKSSNYLNEKGDFYDYYIGNDSTVIDHYSDTILLGIAYNIDPKHPMKSVVQANFYRNERSTMTESLKEQIETGIECNKTYERYWHGSLVWIRLMLLLTDVEGIYIIDGIIMVGLFISLLVILMRKHFFGPCIAIIFGAIATYSFVAPIAFEYTWTYMLMLICTILVVIFADEQKTKSIIPIFIVTGVLTNYFDFLTAETMTLTVPLLTYAYIMKSKCKLKEYIECAFAWLSAYSFMWITKWIIAMCVTKKSIGDIAYANITERTFGSSEEKELFGTLGIIKLSFVNNINALFPLNKELAGVFTFIGIVIVAIYFCIVFQKKSYDAKYIGILFIIAGIPYIRYLVLHGHSSSHYFHTYRAQISTIMMLVLVVAEMVNWDIFAIKRTSKKKSVCKKKRG